ncbi:MAG TPA: sugar phosphate isomerase/epimerase, partial [Oscillospiraceae bacterium]|nr:sugar phosphate isomerase/epimerase [Oscillospiraceae bacterium]
DHDKVIRDTILLAEKLGIGQINTFSGCPGDSEGAKAPNWVTCPWPNEFSEVLEWQWNEVLIPYWKDLVAFAKAHGVNKIGLELHPGFCVYNTESLLRLRAAVGEEIGANLDPSHLLWQGMDPVAVIRALGPAIFHFHAKDTKIDKYNTAVNGVLDTKTYTDEINRSWIFRSVGYGNDASYWKDIISNLRLVGYDHAISIEHEDSLMSQNEGLTKAVNLLKEVLITEATGEAWWI